MPPKGQPMKDKEKLPSNLFLVMIWSCCSLIGVIWSSDYLSQHDLVTSKYINYDQENRPGGMRGAFKYYNTIIL